MLDFVAEQGAENDGFAMTHSGGSYFVIGYGGTLTIPTLDIISTERNIIGNIVGTYNELAELMVLAQTGRSRCTPPPTPLTPPWRPSKISMQAGSADAPSSSPSSPSSRHPSRL